MLSSVIIADAYPLMSEGIKKILSTFHTIDRIFICHSYKELKRTLIQHPPDILLLHAALDTIDEYLLVQEVKYRNAKLKVLLISETTSPLEIKKLYKINLNGFLLRTAKQEELIEAVIAIINDQIYVQEEINTIIVNHALNIDKNRNCNTSLSCREKEVLQLIVEGYTTKEIAKQLFISADTVETHRLKLLQKIGVKNTAGLVREAITKQLID